MGRSSSKDVALAELAIFGDEDLLDEVGMESERNFARTETDGNDIAVFARAARKEAEHVAAEFGQIAQQPASGRTWRQAVDSHGVKSFGEKFSGDRRGGIAGGFRR